MSPAPDDVFTIAPSPRPSPGRLCPPSSGPPSMQPWWAAYDAAMKEFPRIISVDDHVVEPPTVWTDRLPSKYNDVGPRIVRAPVGDITFIGGKFTPTVGNPGDGPDVDWWFYE